MFPTVPVSIGLVNFPSPQRGVGEQEPFHGYLNWR